jgi:hypothetical protein
VDQRLVALKLGSPVKRKARENENDQRQLFKRTLGMIRMKMLSILQRDNSLEVRVVREEVELKVLR